MLTQETVKKTYGYQVNCHLKFGDSLFSEINQTIKSEENQESKRKQKSSSTKKSLQREKGLY